eukprot:TRINITY_DN3060_c0_g1_i2.p1 TRINITY_DN3060_c0_g1~~TRINITY_DN3060_c0_g1_i2.p1  ORF type:complete len:115 (-),score=16.53 TRINITY_DN3060_c0_g1_i2:195-539(-)
MFFHEPKENWFFSYNEVHGEVSLILLSSEMENLKLIHEDVRHYSAEFARISIDEGPLGFDEAGIVDSMAGPLARSGISFFHISTYNTDHSLVLKSELHAAENALTPHGFVWVQI